MHVGFNEARVEAVDKGEHIVNQKILHLKCSVGEHNLKQGLGILFLSI